MSRYREIKISNDHTKEEKEFFQTFPFHKSLTERDYTFNQYQKKILIGLQKMHVVQNINNEVIHFKK